FLAKMPASFASVSGAKPVQPEMPIVTLVCAIAGVASTVAPITAATFNIEVMNCSPSPSEFDGDASMMVGPESNAPGPHPEERAQRASRRMATHSEYAAILRDAAFGRSSG